MPDPATVELIVPPEAVVTDTPLVPLAKIPLLPVRIAPVALMLIAPPTDIALMPRSVALSDALLVMLIVPVELPVVRASMP